MLSIARNCREAVTFCATYCKDGFLAADSYCNGRICMLKYEGWTKQSKMHLRSGKYKFYVRMDFTIPTRTVRIRIFSTKYGSFLKRECTCISGWLVVKKGPAAR